MLRHLHHVSTFGRRIYFRGCRGSVLQTGNKSFISVTVGIDLQRSAAFLVQAVSNTHPDMWGKLGLLDQHTTCCNIQPFECDQNGLFSLFIVGFVENTVSLGKENLFGGFHVLELHVICKKLQSQIASRCKCTSLVSWVRSIRLPQGYWRGGLIWITGAAFKLCCPLIRWKWWCCFSAWNRRYCGHPCLVILSNRHSNVVARWSPVFSPCLYSVHRPTGPSWLRYHVNVRSTDHICTTEWLASVRAWTCTPWQMWYCVHPPLCPHPSVPPRWHFAYCVRCTLNVRTRWRALRTNDSTDCKANCVQFSVLYGQVNVFTCTGYEHRPKRPGSYVLTPKTYQDRQRLLCRPSDWVVVEGPSWQPG